MSKRVKYLAGSLLVAALALIASSAPRAEALTQCAMIYCTNNLACNVPACGDAGFCTSSHHCLPY